LPRHPSRPHGRRGVPDGGCGDLGTGGLGVVGNILWFIPADAPNGGLGSRKDPDVWGELLVELEDCRAARLLILAQF
jgi:hypothetical protein